MLNLYIPWRKLFPTNKDDSSFYRKERSMCCTDILPFIQLIDQPLFLPTSLKILCPDHTIILCGFQTLKFLGSKKKTDEKSCVTS